MSVSTDRLDLYPSRVAHRPSINPRQDPVIWGNAEGPLDPELISGFEENGYLVLPGFLPPSTLKAIDTEVRRLSDDDEVKARPQSIIEPEGRALRSLFEVHRGDDALGAVARNPNLVGVARQLLGDDVYVHQSRVNLKPGFHGKEFYWHSDFETWHTEDGMPRMRAVSCSILLTPNHTYNGPLLTIDGSHNWFVSCVGETPRDNFESSLRRQDLGVPDEESLRELVKRGRISECTGMPGTVVFFDCNLMHGSSGNISPAERHNVFLVYNAMSNTLEEPFAAPGRRPEFIASREPVPIR